MKRNLINTQLVFSLSFGEGWGEAAFLPSFGGVGGGFL